jgi:hypothetical protein
MGGQLRKLFRKNLTGHVKDVARVVGGLCFSLLKFR